MRGAASSSRQTATALLAKLSFDRRMATGLILLFALVPPVGLAVARGYTLLLAERAMILAIAALSLELLVGAAGLLSFGHAAFLGIGAYAAGILASHGLGTLSLALPAALAASALFALLTGAIAVRTRGVYFIMITLAFGQMAFFVATSLAPYGGEDGLSFPTRTLIAGKHLLKSEVVFFYVTLACLTLSYALADRLIWSRFGRVLRGLTDNDVRMQAMGFAPYPYRLTAYVMAGCLCGLAGFLLGNQAEFVSPAYMHWQRSGELIMMVLLGGTGTLYGPILGALAFTLLEEVLARLTEHWKVVLGPSLILCALFARGGLAAAIERWGRGGWTWAAAGRALAQRTGAAVQGVRGRVSEGKRLAERLTATSLAVLRVLLLRAERGWAPLKMALGGLVISFLLLLFHRRGRR
jgi:branched-chain amino acid transport system permease protein